MSITQRLQAIAKALGYERTTERLDLVLSPGPPRIQWWLVGAVGGDQPLPSAHVNARTKVDALRQVEAFLDIDPTAGNPHEHLRSPKVKAHTPPMGSNAADPHEPHAEGHAKHSAPPAPTIRRPKHNRRGRRPVSLRPQMSGRSLARSLDLLRRLDVAIRRGDHEAETSLREQLAGHDARCRRRMGMREGKG